MKSDENNFNILTEPWAITEGALESIFHQLNADNGIYLGLGSTDEKQGAVKLDIVNNIAIIPVQYSLYRSSYNTIRNQVEAAVNDTSARAIVLKINSPGGLVAGCKELADFIFDAGKKKHIYAYADGTMCSSAYWIGSSARYIAAPATASIGSIGVRAIHIDWSGWNKKAGLNFTHIAAGTYKVLGNKDEPLNKNAKEYFQSRLNTLHTIFVDSVARNRGLGADSNKLHSIANGKVFLAMEASKNGLIERIEQDFESYFKFILVKETAMPTTLVNSGASVDGVSILKTPFGLNANEMAGNKGKESRDKSFEERARAYSDLVNFETSVGGARILKETFELNDNETAENKDNGSLDKSFEARARAISDLVNFKVSA